GGSRGIGEAIATAFAREGAVTWIASRKPEGVEAAVARIRASTGGEVHGLPLHVGDLAAIEAGLARIAEAHGPVDVLVNNAATNPHFGPMFDVGWPAWEKTFQVNLMGPFALTREVARRLIE